MREGRRPWRRRALLVALCAATLAACGSSGAAAKLPTTSSRGLPLADALFQRGSRTLLHLTVEVADNQQSQATGLMGVRHLAPDQGEAFVFPSRVGDAFWMKDTLIPLDIAFVDPRGRVVDVQHMVPCTADPCALYYAAQLYHTAVEAGDGVLSRAGLRPGDTMQLTRRAPARSAAP